MVLALVKGAGLGDLGHTVQVMCTAMARIRRHTPSQRLRFISPSIMNPPCGLCEVPDTYTSLSTTPPAAHFPSQGYSSCSYPVPRPCNNSIALTCPHRGFTINSATYFVGRSIDDAYGGRSAQKINPFARLAHGFTSHENSPTTPHVCLVTHTRGSPHTHGEISPHARLDLSHTHGEDW